MTYFMTDLTGEVDGETDNAKREDTKMTSRLKAMVRPFNKKRRGWGRGGTGRKKMV